MERLKHIKDSLLGAIEGQIGDLSNVDAHELGEVVDMVKDMEEAIYYCSIVKAMEEQKEEKEIAEKYYSTRRPQYIPIYMNEGKNDLDSRDLDRQYGRMYYSDNTGTPMNSNNGNNSRGYRPYYTSPEWEKEYAMSMSYPAEIHDVREGRSPISRRSYIESKELHKETPVRMKELEKYLQELSQDITEMISDATPEEKTILQQKLNTLATKVGNV